MEFLCQCSSLTENIREVFGIGGFPHDLSHHNDFMVCLTHSESAWFRAGNLLSVVSSYGGLIWSNGDPFLFVSLSVYRYSEYSPEEIHFDSHQDGVNTEKSAYSGFDDHEPGTLSCE
jgi:hypothetical protein